MQTNGQNGSKAPAESLTHRQSYKELEKASSGAQEAAPLQSKQQRGSAGIAKKARVTPTVH